MIQFCLPYQDESIGLVSHVPGMLPKWQALYWPYQTVVWIFILTAPFGVIIAITTMNLFNSKKRKLKSSELIYQVFKAMISQGKLSM